MRFIKGEPHQCFGNTFAACLKDRRLTYVEGYIFPRHIHHAWAIEPDGEIVECTLSPEYVEGRERSYKPGIAFSEEEVTKRLTESNGMLPLMTIKELEMLDMSLGAKFEVPGDDGEMVPLSEGMTPSQCYRERLISGENETREGG